ncbi:MAG: hypothetical protein JSV30_01700 [Candidatus Omnitrophota bacterium]|nr:MAG: hypothetical protein JSV30_01700 [Candidatus Omnitrophota bacterium]
MLKDLTQPRKILNKDYLKKRYFREKMTLKQIATEVGVSVNRIAYLMSKNGLKRRNASEATYNYFNKEECFKIKRLSANGELLKNVALILYWCEGTNKRFGKKATTTLAFTNTDIGMLKIWLKFLNLVCNLRANKIKARLYLHKNQKGEKLKRYWSSTLRIPLTQFENISYTKKDSTQNEYKGTVKIKVHNVKLYQLVQDWIAELRDRILEIDI